ncbi:hypothetical protein [Methanoculleus sp. 10]|nr:hypothetical protein [Methanoculleus sp. 10]
MMTLTRPAGEGCVTALVPDGGAKPGRGSAGSAASTCRLRRIPLPPV